MPFVVLFNRQTKQSRKDILFLMPILSQIGCKIHIHNFTSKDRAPPKTLDL
jgi:hypothetical protein